MYLWFKAWVVKTNSDNGNTWLILKGLDIKHEAFSWCGRRGRTTRWSRAVLWQDNQDQHQHQLLRRKQGRPRQQRWTDLTHHFYAMTVAKDLFCRTASSFDWCELCKRALPHSLTDVNFVEELFNTMVNSDDLTFSMGKTYTARETSC